MTDSEPSPSEIRAGRQPEDAHDRGRARLWTLCGEFVQRLSVSGVVVSVVDLGGRRSTVASTDLVAARWDEVEMEIGAGPLHDAVSLTAPQLVPDIGAGLLNPLVASHLDDLGMRAVFAFPLTLGSATVGAVGLYRRTPGVLSHEELRIALRLTRTVAGPAVRTALQLAANDRAGGNDQTVDSRQDDDFETRQAPELRREVHQATGMVSAQLDVTMTESFARLRAHAVASERSLVAIALDVVAGRMNFLDLDIGSDLT